MPMTHSTLFQFFSSRIGKTHRFVSAPGSVMIIPLCIRDGGRERIVDRNDRKWRKYNLVCHRIKEKEKKESRMGEHHQVILSSAS